MTTGAGSRNVALMKRVLANGIPTEATVVNLEESTTEINERQMTIVTLAFRQPDGRTGTARVKQLVPLNIVNGDIALGLLSN